jgi:hypothetical protein
MMLTEKEDLVLAGLIIDNYNLLKRSEGRSVQDEDTLAKILTAQEAVDEKISELYGGGEEEPDMIEVPVELFHRMAAEVQHHKGMLSGVGAGLVVTFRGSLTGHREYGVSRDMEFTFKVMLRAPQLSDVTGESLEETVNCALSGWRATLLDEVKKFQDEVQALKKQSEAN